MTVYIVLGADLQTDPYREVCGVFATSDEASAWISRNGKDWFRVDEWRVGDDLDAKYAR